VDDIHHSVVVNDSKRLLAIGAAEVSECNKESVVLNLLVLLLLWFFLVVQLGSTPYVGEIV